MYALPVRRELDRIEIIVHKNVLNIVFGIVIMCGKLFGIIRPCKNLRWFLYRRYTIKGHWFSYSLFKSERICFADLRLFS